MINTILFQITFIIGIKVNIYNIHITIVLIIIQLTWLTMIYKS